MIQKTMEILTEMNLVGITTRTNNIQAFEEKIAVRFENENVWLTQKHMAELFGCSIDDISLHLKNIYSTGEESSIIQKEGNNSWATDKLKSYIFKGFITS